MTIEIDDETRRMMINYSGRDYDKPRRIEQTVFNEYGPEEWSLVDFLNLLEQAKRAIPDELWPEAKVELQGGYEDSTSLKISYPRTETSASVSARVSRALEYARNKQARERDLYQELKAKFETGKPSS